MGRIYNTNREKRNACKVLAGKPEGKRPTWIEVTDDRDRLIA
jgi:hypothetical protein